jgi:regulator of protease activity HflC (stomatin/prohibitin superfamily)
MDMARADNGRETYENTVEAKSGWLMLVIAFALIPAAIATFVLSVRAAIAGAGPAQVLPGILLAAVMVVSAVVFFSGLFTLQPNEARILILFGSYKGTVRSPGFHFANPFYARHRGRASSSNDSSAGTKAVEVSKRLLGLGNLPTKISLRARNFNSETLKVNDKRGNPVEIAAVVVWRVADTAQAVFDVEEFESYVAVQAESAIRSVASHYAYDHGDDDEITLRGGGDEVAAEMTRELQARLNIAGVEIEESRLTHLAYAPEIASAMLRRQQAEAIIEARNKIVHGAVSMVQMALHELEEKDVIKLDEERKAAMVSNLLVVLCGTSEAAPVINTGTLYT